MLAIIPRKVQNGYKKGAVFAAPHTLYPGPLGSTNLPAQANRVTGCRVLEIAVLVLLPERFLKIHEAW